MHRISRTVPLFLLIGCSQDPIEALASYAEEVCACEGDADCIERVRAEWEDANVRQIATSDLGDDDRARGVEHIARALECIE